MIEDPSRGPRLRVSVLLAVKDEQQFIVECVEGLMRQRAGIDLEAIFVDDNSTDKTVAILEEYAARCSWLRVVRNPHRGKVSAFNHAYSLCRGDYICVFAGDDIMPPDSLTARARPLAKEELRGIPALTLCKLKTLSEIARYDGHIIPRQKGLGGVSGQCLMFNRACASLIFPVPEDLPNEDTWMHVFIKFAKALVVIHAPIVGCHYRIHEGNSMNRLTPFSQFNEKLHVRHRAYQKFLESKVELTTSDGRRKIAAFIEAEEMRYEGAWIRILFTTELPAKERLRMLFLSNRILYHVRNSLFSLFSGR